MAEHNDLGEWGGAEATCYLKKQGYVIRDSVWRFGKRDLDIVAVTEDGEWLVFVEVKTRTSDDIMEPSQAVTRKKMLNVAAAANAYLKALPDGNFKVRFDIISIVGSKGDVRRIEHIKDAFNPLML